MRNSSPSGKTLTLVLLRSRMPVRGWLRCKGSNLFIVIGILVYREKKYEVP
jgi:hypothetical protein